MNRRNYQKELELQLAENERRGVVPSLLLHSCCAPCSSYVLEYLSRYFEITVFYYNPNISPAAEYEARAKEQARLIREMDFTHPVHLICGEYRPEKFYEAAKGLEAEPEGGRRCAECYRLRLRETAEKAKRGGFDYFTTTLTISPLKAAEQLNKIGEELAGEYGITWLPSDFKKKDGYRRSVELSDEHSLYRQDFCGCAFSRREKDSRHDRNKCYRLDSPGKLI